ncbi:unnamed protein product [Arabidopsis lyrata]|uniref:Uncharacterized protein n=1 Tax=Arabidopsis lyrata subsp. lyrata TaxID=81972 RepID=D7LHM4_ARALL|nr:uncharacterized protein LOC9315163 [Arabidopsis lyrata subsp. lyrata]EFH55355.1 hypothetical protein ARALYDRAFT_901664 [Arabidopsis lyrata subsp. lyrata]CAH8264012.1 unnamed protein product [Arabidopsis lyrata]|eukprot:XP_002879096.1 uncharacterized protein LOC9315163 [Arabidopsis lyrata subsp. lyrata]
MISILAQERLLGFTLGTALTGFVVFEQRKLIHESVSDPKSQFVDQSQVRDRIFGKKYRMEFASLWNKAVDQTFEPAIEYLSSRKW